MMILAFAENAIQLVPDGTLLLHLLIVVGMVAVLNRTLFRPVNRVLQEREAQTTGRRNQAKVLQSQIEDNLLRYERGLREARATAYRLIEVERTEALREREEKVTQVKDEIRSWIAMERSGIERQAEEVRRTLDVESIQSAIRITSQILHREVSNAGRPRPSS
jgi:F0F1-type ATP synthase membrane subunit b/b'